MSKGISKSSTSTSTPESVNNLLRRTGFEKDHLYCAEGQKGFTGEATRMAWDKATAGLTLTSNPKNSKPDGRFTSPVLHCKFPASEFLPSWNIKLTHENQGFQIFMRFYREAGAKPSPWLFVGEGGQIPQGAAIKLKDPQWGQTRIDYVDLKKPATAFQFRVECHSGKSAIGSKGPVIRRIYVHYSGNTDKRPPSNASAPAPKTSIDVPYRSQLTVDKVELRNLICCPTSLAMVLEHNGTRKETLDICAQVYDARNDIYGVWPRTSHVAFQHGLQSWVHRFRTHDEVAQFLNTGQPIIASIRVGEGELRGAKYPQSRGHIIVITGLNERGDYIVNDPASAGPQGAEILYFAEDMEKVWLDKGGVAILVKPEKSKR